MKGWPEIKWEPRDDENIVERKRTHEANMGHQYQSSCGHGSRLLEEPRLPHRISVFDLWAESPLRIRTTPHQLYRTFLRSIHNPERFSPAIRAKRIFSEQHDFTEGEDLNGYQ